MVPLSVAAALLGHPLPWSPGHSTSGSQGYADAPWLFSAAQLWADVWS